MKAPSLASMTVALVLAVYGMPAFAQPRHTPSTRVKLQDILPKILTALSTYHTALGLKDDSARDAASASCFSHSKCDLNTTLDAVTNSAAQISEEVHERQADDNRLGGSFANAAAQGLAPAIPALSDWARLSHALHSGTSDKHIVVARSVRNSAQKVQSSFESTAASIKAAIQYLGYSGVATAPLESGLDAALRGN
jgi:hypothetical protein